MTAKAYGYVRVSTDEQALNGLSLRAQKSRIKSYAQAHGLKLVKIYEDKGISGRNMERPGLQELLQAVKNKECESVIIYRLSRLSRSTRDLLLLIEELFIQGNTQLISVHEHIDTKTAMGRFLLTIMGALAQMERELISERTKAALRFKKAQGERLGSPPYGYEWNKEQQVLEPVSGEIRTIRSIFKKRKEGMPFGKIASWLNEKGVATKRNGKWHAGTVRYLINNKQYASIADSVGYELP